MSTKELILAELDRVSPLELPRILQYLQELQPTSTVDNEENKTNPTFWEAYLQSEQEYHEVYQRLADA